MGETSDPTPIGEAPEALQEAPPKELNTSSEGDWEEWVVEVPVFPKLSALYGNFEMYEGPIRSEMLPKEWVGKIDATHWRSPFIVPIEGDGMVGAGIPDGCEVLVNPAEHVSECEAAIVLYVSDVEVAVKWIYRGLDGSVEIRSATLLYPPKQFTKEDINNNLFVIVGKVVRVFSYPKRGM